MLWRAYLRTFYGRAALDAPLPLLIVLGLGLELVLVIEVFSALTQFRRLEFSLGAADAHRRLGNIDYEFEFETIGKSHTPRLAVDPHQGIQKILGTDDPRRVTHCVHDGGQAVR